MKLQEQNKNYLGAEEAKKQAEKLKTQISKMEVKQLKFKQKHDLEEVKEIQKQEEEAFETKWVDTFSMLEQECYEMRIAL